MKKLFLFITGWALLSVNAFAQTSVAGPIEAWAFPAIYEMDQEVTFYIDLSGGGFTEGEDIYWWVWQPGEPDAGNFANSSEFAKWEYAGYMIWKKTIVPTEYFHMSKADVLAWSEQKFWCRVKDLTGTKQSDVFSISYSTGTPAGVLDGNVMAADPGDFTILKPFSVYFDSKLATGFTAGEDVYFNSQFNDTEGGDDYAVNYDASNPDKTKAIYLGDGIYRKDMDILNYYSHEENPALPELSDEYEMKYIKIQAINGKGAETEMTEFKVVSLDPGIPATYVLPSHLTYYDILAINRVNPSKGEEPISFIISCSGYKNITGELERLPNTGTDRNRGVFIYLPEHWDTAPTKEIRIRLTGADNNRFYDQRITLLPLEETTQE